MVRLTLIARKADGLPLAEGLDNNKEHDLDQYKQQAKVCSPVLPVSYVHSCPGIDSLARVQGKYC